MQENANSSTSFFSKANLYICTERAVDSLETYYRFLNIFHLKFGQSNAYLIKHDRQEGLRESKVVQFRLHVQLQVSHRGYRLYHYSTEEMLVKTHNSSVLQQDILMKQKSLVIVVRCWLRQVFSILTHECIYHQHLNTFMYICFAIIITTLN